jgi:hypothetical protein
MTKAANAMTDKEITEHMAAEMAGHPPVEVVLTATGALHLAGLLQLVLRHPYVGGSSRDTAVTIIEQIRVYFGDCPTTLFVLQRGDDPSQDRVPPKVPES